MKNLIVLFCALLISSLPANAQIFVDDFESYSLGDIGCQNPTVWNTCDGICDNGTNLIINDDIVRSGSQSGYIGPGSVQDLYLLLGNLTTGDYTLQFYMYITGGSTGYFNIQGNTDLNCATGVFNSSNLYFNNGGAAPGVFEDQTTGETGFYPEDAWFIVSIYFDLADPSYQISIDESLVNANPVPFQADNVLGAINFFSIDANNNYWLDDMLYMKGPIIGLDDFSSEDFSVYPNPVKDVLTLRSSTSVDQIEVYDVLGKLVLNKTPNSISPTVNMSDLNSGVYFLKVTIDNQSKTIKIIK